LRSAERRAAIGQRARASVVERFSLDRQAACFVDVLGHVLQGRAGYTQ
jgi:hypothetical protein